jgi:hypothetical protein
MSLFACTLRIVQSQTGIGIIGGNDAEVKIV